MARTNILSTRTMDFGEFIGNGRIYRVPIYQRDYSWSEEQWEDLWNDIIELRGKPGDVHYMGVVVVQGGDDRQRWIIDGQQRTATLSILALAVIDRLHTLADGGIEPDDNRTRARELRARFIGERDPASLVESSKLFLNETDDGFYQDHLVQLREPLNPRRLPKSNRLLWESFLYFRRRLSEAPGGAAIASLVSETVSRQLLFTVISVEDDINAYSVFETLNARGLDLTTTDLLKNYLFSRVHAAPDLAALRRRWRTIISTVTAERFPEFLRYHLLTTEPRVRSERLFNAVRDTARSPEDVFRLMDNLERRAELFAALGDPGHAYWNVNAEARPFIRALNLFRVSQTTPLLFAAHETLPPDTFASVLRMVSVLLFRYAVVSGHNTNALEPASHRAARAVLDGTATGAAAVARELRDVYVDDAEFEQDFATLSVEARGQRKRLAKYILARLESDHSGRSLDPETDPATVEHILPENPDQAWDAAFDADQHAAYVDRLGNLALLEPALNRALGNAAFAEKLRAYGGSSYTMTRAIAEEDWAEWTPAIIDERQRRMARRATHLWRIDF